MVDTPDKAPFNELEGLCRKLLAEEYIAANNKQSVLLLTEGTEEKDSSEAVALKAMQRLITGPGNYTDKGTEWNIVDNLRWLADQSDRPGYVPCGMLTGMFLMMVADRFNGFVHELNAKRREDTEGSDPI